MKKLVYVSTLVGMVALMVMLVVGSAAAAPGEIEPEIEPGGEGEIEPEPEGGEAAEAEAAEADPKGTAVRIDFELAPGHSAKRGHYSVQLEGGAEVASWYALDGWLDSGWIEDVEIPGERYVQVLYYPGPETEPTVMRILNHAPDSEYGWLADGVAHALEVAWADQPIEGEGEMEVSDEDL